MNTIQFPGFGQISQIAADSLYRDLKPIGEVIDRNFAFDSGNLKDVGLAEILQHVRFCSEYICVARLRVESLLYFGFVIVNVLRNERERKKN